MGPTADADATADPYLVYGAYGGYGGYPYSGLHHPAHFPYVQTVAAVAETDAKADEAVEVKQPAVAAVYNYGLPYGAYAGAYNPVTYVKPVVGKTVVSPVTYGYGTYPYARAYSGYHGYS